NSTHLRDPLSSTGRTTCAAVAAEGIGALVPVSAAAAESKRSSPGSRLIAPSPVSGPPAESSVGGAEPACLSTAEVIIAGRAGPGSSPRPIASAAVARPMQPRPRRVGRGGEAHEADASAALLLVEVQIEHADAGEIGEEFGKSRIFGVDVRVDVVGRDALGAEVVENLCQFGQFVADGDRFLHGAPIG